MQKVCARTSASKRLSAVTSFAKQSMPSTAGATASCPVGHLPLTLIAADGRWLWSPPGRLRLRADDAAADTVRRAAVRAARLGSAEAWVLSLDGTTAVKTGTTVGAGSHIFLLRREQNYASSSMPEPREEEPLSVIARREVAALRQADTVVGTSEAQPDTAAARPKREQRQPAAMTEDDLAELSEAFTLFGGGRRAVAARDLGQLMRSVALTLSEDALHAFRCRLRHSESVQLDEFVEFVREQTALEEQTAVEDALADLVEACHVARRSLPRRVIGRISRQEFLDVARDILEWLTEEDLGEMGKEAVAFDDDGDDTVAFEEFVECGNLQEFLDCL